MRLGMVQDHLKVGTYLFQKVDRILNESRVRIYFKLMQPAV